MNPAIGQDSREHRKRGHRHRDAQEKREAGERHVAGRKFWIKIKRNRRAQQEGQHDARVGDRDRRVAAFAQQRGIELEPDQEHIKDDADLRDDVEIRTHHRREKISFRARHQASEQRRTEHDSRENFADDRRLIGAAEDPAHRARGRDNHHQREQHVQQIAFVGARRGRAEDVDPDAGQARRAYRRTSESTGTAAPARRSSMRKRRRRVCRRW